MLEIGARIMKKRMPEQCLPGLLSAQCLALCLLLLCDSWLMRSQHTYYTEGYKYRTSESIFKLLEIYPEKEIRSDGKMIILTREGLLFICFGAGGLGCVSG